MPVTRRRWVYPHGGTRKDGSRFPIEVAISPFQVDGDQYFSCAVRDLTANWAAEARLRRLAAAIEQAGDAIAIMDADQRIQYVNPQYEKQTGSTQDEVLGRRPASGASDDGVYADMWATVGQGRTWTGQVRSRRRDGAVRDEELTVTPVFDGTASISGYVAVMRDITKRLEADLERRQLAEALQHCTDSIEILDSQGRIVYVNAAFEASNGQRLADIRGSRPEALTDFGPAADRYEDMMRTAYRGGRPWSGTLKSLSADGGTREEDVTVSPLRDDRGQVSGYVVVKRDTTDRRRLESQIRQRQKLESIGQLADGIAHELNAPIQLVDDNLRFLRESFGELDRLLAEFAGLGKRSNAVPPSAIAGCLQKADVEFLQREIGRALDQSGDGLHRMAGIVRAMRDMSYSSPEKAPVDLNRAIQNTITVSTNEWQHVAEIQTSFDPALPPVVCMPGDVSLVLLGLLVNAAHAISETNRSGIRGKGVITVSTHRLNEFAEIRIGDTGRGVPPEARRRLFDPQAAPGTAGHDLSMAHEVIVNQHGGTIALDSEPGKGATFIIRLPIAAAASVGAIAAA
jgi:PAS domain S-box-containing protein